MSDSQWILDIAAEMPDGAATIAELDALTAKLMGASRRSDDFQAALKRVTSDLDAAKTASASAAAALATGSEQYKLLERDAIRTAKALELAQSKGRFDPRAAREADAARVALDAYTGTLRELEQTSATAQGKQDQLAKSLANLNKLGAHADQRNALLNQRYEKAGQLVGLLPGPLAQVGSNLLRSARASHEMGIAFGGSTAKALLLAAGVAAVVVGVVALTAALVAGAAAAATYAIKLADTHREASLTREAFAALSAENAAAVSGFDAISAATGATDETLLSLTKQLKSAKVEAGDMQRALLAAATAEAALGKGGAGEFISQISAGELAVAEFAQTVETQLGGVAAKRMRGLTAQAALFGKRWDSIFSGLNLEPVLDAVAVLTGMLDKSNPLAQAFGDAVSGAFKIVERYALPAAYAVEAFALGFAIQLTKLYLVVKPALQWLGDLFGLDDNTLATTLDLAAIAGKVAVGVFVAMGVAAATLIAVVGGVGAVFTAAVGAVVAFGAGLVWIASHVWPAVFGAVAGIADLGKMIVMGLVEGVIGAASFLYDAVRTAVTGAINAAKEVLGIASPSKVFAEIGVNTVAGFTGAVDAGAEDVQGSMASLVTPDPVALPVTGANAQGGGGSSRGSAAIDLSGATFVFNGVPGAEQARDMFSEMFTRLLEGDADSLGGAEVPA